MLRLEVSVGELAIHLRVGPRHGEADAGKHVVCCNPVDVVLIHLGTNDDAVVVFILFPLPLAGPFLPDVLRPSRCILILGHLFQVHIRVYRSSSTPCQRHGAASACWGVWGEPATRGYDVIGVVGVVAGARS